MNRLIENWIARFTIVGMLACVVTEANAQLATGSTAPNFTTVDINGDTHTLHDYLDQGKGVVLDFSTTWCTPCWNYHGSNVLKDLYNTYGPSGTDEVMVFYIESDGQTGLPDLMGQTASSKGDWVTGTPYPIIDDSASSAIQTRIAEMYNVMYYPTIYFICPDRTVTEDSWQDGYFDTDGIYAHFEGCLGSTSLEESLVEEQVRFFPTMTDDQVQIRSEKPLKEINVYSSSGQLVKNIFATEDLSSISLQGIGKGLFVIHFVLEDGVQIGKVVVI